VSTAPSSNGSETKTSGLKIDRVFSDPNVHPFDQLAWAERTAEIKDETGKHVFLQKNVEFPETWSQLAVNVVASKYFYGDVQNGNGSPDVGQREWSVKQLIGRVAGTLADWGDADGYFDLRSDADAFADELIWLLVNQCGAFNSPVWFNVGLYHEYKIEGNTTAWRWDNTQEKVVPLEPGEAYKYPQGSACFIQGVEDTMQSIMDLVKSEAMLFKAGSGTGTDLSTLRSTKEKLAGGGKPSGPVSFFKLFDTTASIVKSGGKTRRAARMQTLRCDHPDVMEFIECKGKEDRKARALIEAGYSAGLTGDMDEAYSSVSFQNTNTAIRLTNDFMNKVVGGDRDPYYWTKAVLDGSDVEKLNAQVVLRRIAEEAHACGDPGVQFHDTINQWHTVPNTGPIESSNPCCFTYFTYIDTSEGRIPIGELAEMDAAGKELPYAFAFDRTTGMPVLRKIRRAWKAGDTKKITRVTTQRGLVFESTPDHRYLLHDGEYVEAALLRPGERLRKINRQVNTRRSNRKWLLHKVTSDRPNGCSPQNRWMWEQVHGSLSDEFEVHHVNEDPTDDRLSNFQVIKKDEHDVLHSKGEANARFIKADPRLMVEVWEAIENHKRGTFKDRRGVSVSLWNKFIVNNGLKGKVPLARYSNGEGLIQGKSWTEFADWIESQRSLVNDRVESVDTIELDEPVAVYDIEVDDVHNFGIGSKDSVHSIVVSNSEYMHLSDSACNLASLNLMKFVKPDGYFDAERFEAAVRIFIIAQDILVDRASYPTEKIARNSHDYRPLGLGYCNLGTLLMTSGLPYDSEDGRSLAGAITATMQAAAALASAEVAEVKGAFAGYEKNKKPYGDVMVKHYLASGNGYDGNFDRSLSGWLWSHAFNLWAKVVDPSVDYGFRNSQFSVIAPTGTIAFMMDADTTGLEPELALVKYKKLAGGGVMKIVNQSVRAALKKLGYAGESIAVVDGDPDHGNLTDDNAEDMIKWIAEKRSLEGYPLIDPKHLPVFDCAFPVETGGRSIHWKGHIEMMAAIQPFISGALSKTVNMPSDATVEDILDVYQLGWKRGLKAIAIYRDGSKGVQPLNTKADAKADAKSVPVPVPVVPQRKRLPETRQAVVHKFEIGGHEGYITVGLYPDGSPGEIFVTISKEGSTISGLLDSWATSVSLGLQYGVPLAVLVEKFAHSRYEPSGFSRCPDVPIAKSLTDYISRWLGCRFIPGYREANSPAAKDDWTEASKPVEAKSSAKYQQDSPVCTTCGGLTIRAGTCYTCTACGSTSGCG